MKTSSSVNLTNCTTHLFQQKHKTLIAKGISNQT